jgi:hypothetical protein
MVDLNTLSPLGFQFKLARTPNAEYQVQGCSFPGMSLGVAQIQTGFVKIPEPGNISYETFSVTFKVSEDLSSYLEIFNWMVELGHPDTLEQYRNPKSDASLVILNNKKRPSFSVKFTEVFPVYLSPIQFDTTMATVEPVTATAQFTFLRMYFDNLKKIS